MAAFTGELDLVWILPRLALGARFPGEAVEYLARQLGIRLIVDVRLEDGDDEQLLREHGIEALHLPIEALSPLVRRQLHRGVHQVLATLSGGHKVYIHCEQGLGRSVLLTLCVLVALGWSPLEALARIKHLRPEVYPSPDQLEAFRGWSGEYHQHHSPAWTPPALEALTELAYSTSRPGSSPG